MQNYLWRNVLRLPLLLHDRVVKALLHSFYAYILLLHDLPQLLRVRLHQIHCLIMHIHIGRLVVRGVRVIVRLKMFRINVVSHVSRPGS